MLGKKEGLEYRELGGVGGVVFISWTVLGGGRGREDGLGYKVYGGGGKM